MPIRFSRWAILCFAVAAIVALSLTSARGEDRRTDKSRLVGMKLNADQLSRLPKRCGTKFGCRSTWRIA